MEKRRDVFQAIADPTRREIINLLAHKSLNLNAISEHFNTSRPTISQHIKFLQDCGLITINKQGRERHCELKPEKLREADAWISHYRTLWTKKFTSLKNFIDNENLPNTKKKKS